MKVLLIIPAYNEEESILKTVTSIETFRQTVDYQLDYIVVNDGSTDRTKEILTEHQINAVHLVMNLGIGGAVQTGYKYAQRHDYDIAVQFDGDGQHDINSLNNLVTPIQNGEADFTIGSRFLQKNQSEFQTTFMRRLGINLISFLIRLVSRKKILDTTSGYRAANRKIIQLFAHRYPTKYPEPESIVHLVKKNYRIKECSVNMFERSGGVSSITPIKSITYMSEVCTSILVAFLMKEND